MHIRANQFTQIGDLVNEADLGSQKGIGGILDQFGTFEFGHMNRCFNEIDWAIEFAQ